MKKLIAICILSIVAFFNASYLTVQNYKIEQATIKGGVTSFCDISNTFSCSNVLSSPYSKVFGVAFPAIAMAVYPIIFLIAFLGINSVIRKPFHILTAMGIGGMMFNGFFISREFLYIGSYCPLCLVCTGIITTIFILGVIGIFHPLEDDKPKTILGKIKAFFKSKKKK